MNGRTWIEAVTDDIVFVNVTMDVGLRLLLLYHDLICHRLFTIFKSNRCGG